jgi:hypothetical protein
MMLCEKPARDRPAFHTAQEGTPVTVPTKTSSPYVRAYIDKVLSQTEEERQAEHAAYETRLRQEQRAERLRGWKHFAMFLAVLAVALFLYDHGQLWNVLGLVGLFGLLFGAAAIDKGVTFK